MTRKRAIIHGFLILLMAGVFFYLPFLENFYVLSRSKLEDLGSKKLDDPRQNIEKEISAPAPLRVENGPGKTPLTRKGVIDFTNTERQKNGESLLKENIQLNSAAEAKAEDILDKQYFDHVSPDGKGPDYFVSGSSYDYISIGENLALGSFADDQALVDAWMASPGHRENILHAQFQEIGVAVVKGMYEGKSAWVAVQEFGTPTSACLEADDKLKNNINANKKEIDKLTEEIQSEKSKIKDMSPREAGYSQAIDDYNTLVAEYNNFISKTKKMIEQYNAQVNKYNSCLENL
jgi:uncharacterized protein YkwD